MALRYIKYLGNRARSAFASLAEFRRYRQEALRLERHGSSEPWLLKHHNAFQGRACFVLGNGPSLSSVSESDLLRLPSFGTNGVFLKFAPTYYVTISGDFYKNHEQAIRELRCERKFLAPWVESVITGADDESILPCHWPKYGHVWHWGFPVPLRFSKRPDRIVHVGGTVLTACLQLSYWMGFTTVILLGVDHDFGLDRSTLKYGGTCLKIAGLDPFHFHPDYLRTGATSHCDMLASERAFALALKAFLRDGREIINCTEGSLLDIIPRQPLETCLRRVECWQPVRSGTGSIYVGQKRR